MGAEFAEAHTDYIRCQNVLAMSRARKSKWIRQDSRILSALNRLEKGEITLVEFLVQAQNTAKSLQAHQNYVQPDPEHQAEPQADPEHQALNPELQADTEVDDPAFPAILPFVVDEEDDEVEEELDGELESLSPQRT